MRAPQAEPPKLPGGVEVVTPANDVLLKQSGVFGLLAVWTLVQVCLSLPLALTGSPETCA